MSEIGIKNEDIVKAKTDVIVNAANSHLKGTKGVCGAIFKAAGWDEMQKACDQLGYCPEGEVWLTKGFSLRARYVIHAVGPVWHGGKKGEKELLYNAYQASLKLARKKHCHSITFPLLSAGVNGVPVDVAWHTAIKACIDFLDANSDYSITIHFAVPNDKIRRAGHLDLDNQMKGRVGWGKELDADEKLLMTLNGPMLKSAINTLRTVTKITEYDEWFPKYPEGVFDAFRILDLDYDYPHHIDAVKEKQISEMNVRELQTYITYISRGEHFCDGFMVSYIESGDFLKALFRLDDLLLKFYKEMDLPAESRFQNPLIWYSMNAEHEPVLVQMDGNWSITQGNLEIENASQQVKDEAKRAILYDAWKEIRVEEGNAILMKRKHFEGRAGQKLVFMSCTDAERNVFSGLSEDEVYECRKNIDDFYQDRELQLLWNEVILHPVCMVLDEDHEMHPMAIGKLDKSSFKEIDVAADKE